MSDSIEEQITQDLVETLESVVASAGYQNTLVVERTNRLGNSAIDSTVVVDEQGIFRSENSPLGRDIYIKRYSVFVPAIRAEDDTGSDGGRSSSFRSDIIKALTSDSSYNRGGLAIDTVFTSAEPINEPGMAGERINFDVTFWTDKDDPFSQ